MRRIGDRGALPDPLTVYRELQNDPDLPPSVARDAVPLAELMEAAPRVRHAPAYAVMVAESGIRNRLCLAEYRMVQASETGELEAAWRMAAQAHNEVDACTARWLALPAPLRRESRGETITAATTPGSQRAEAQIPRPSGEETAIARGAAVRDLAAAPARLAAVRAWLRPEHFARPDDGALYGVMRDMDAAGMPVDPVTVTWEAARHGVHAEPGSLTGGMGPFAEASAQEVYRHAQLAFVAQTGRTSRTRRLARGPLRVSCCTWRGTGCARWRPRRHLGRHQCARTPILCQVVPRPPGAQPSSPNGRRRNDVLTQSLSSGAVHNPRA